MDKYNAIVIVVYNKKVSESTTINTLSKYVLKNSVLVIYNNGPKEVALDKTIESELQEKFMGVKVVNNLSNSPLSILYNEFIAGYADADKYVILDDDSTITDSFIKALDDDDYDIELPKIISRTDQVTYYPISSGEVVSFDGFLKTQGTFSIGSGLIIKRSMVDIFNKHKITLFDENFALYGVDVSLFRRMYKLDKQGESFKIRTKSNILHSLSRVEGEESAFRKKERLIDVAISTRRYPTLRMHVHLFKKLLMSLFGGDFAGFYAILNAYCYGMHPRCRPR
ncbi:glycosyltransferase family 2 protein [Serratia sp. NPDC078593]|uniref:glycosyltransferase family 2 protein n=1 Tax=unclassified Serratia (in: enterobacteria) TaxID=2647522 RepID=UPI0037D11F17